jgi:hypothetical protein
VSKGDDLGYVEIAGGESGYVRLVAGEDFSYSFADNETAELVLSGNGFVYAPVSEGQQAGYAHICIGEHAVGKIPIFYGDTVEQLQQEKHSIWERIFGRTD